MSRPAFFISAAVLLAGLVGVPAQAVMKTKTPAKSVVKVYAPPKATGPLVPRKLDGLLTPKSVSNLYPIAVMIDNHTAARPQSGLNKASVVYETLAEGGIPRLMAIFGDTNVKVIGPIRSTRPYFVQEAAEYNAIVVHAGGSPDGLQLLTKLRLPNFEGLTDPFAKYFMRLYAGDVHGLYTSMVNLWNAIGHTKLAGVVAKYQSWQFGPDAGLASRPNGKHGATIDFGYGRLYNVEWRYNKSKNYYERWVGGQKNTDRQNRQQLWAKNVIILNVPKEKVLDRQGRLDINVLGKGTGSLLQNGKVTAITWSKPSTRSRTVFKNKSGQEVTLLAGSTWIEIVPKGHPVKVY